MRVLDIFKEKILGLLLIVIAQITVVIFLLPFNVTSLITVYIFFIPIVVYIIFILIEAYKKKQYYYFLENNLDKLKEKYLISEILKEPDFIEGKILKETLEVTGKSMIENVNKYKFKLEDYKEYIEMWIHEIKIPLATTKLIIENNKTKVTKSIGEEVTKIEDYIEQVLFYARSNTVEKDYCINKCMLKEIVNNAIIKNKELIVYSNIELKLHDLEKVVYTDSKWCVFIFNQIIQNSIKYSKRDNKKIEIYSNESKDSVILYIKDNGIGISKNDISRVFDKSFTGQNGRIIGKKSTGMGLYLCKKLCDKLDLKINIDSEENIGTIVTITFPINSYTNFNS